MEVSVFDDNGQDVKALTDEVLYALKNCDFGSYSMNRLNIDGMSVDTWQEGNKKIHSIVINLSFAFVGA
jgi:hypothetical protein